MSASNASRKNILLMMTGSIACYKACALVSRLFQSGYEVQVVMSDAAKEFVGTATLEGLTGKKVLTNLFEPGTMMDHIHQMRWADFILVAPATANSLNKFANGIADDLIGTLFLAHDFKRPFVIAPAMNTSMYQHPTTVAAIFKLKNMGIEFVEPAHGHLACGETGAGRMAEPDQIFNRINAHFTTSSTPKKKILVTGGGTVEAIDDVRSITNTSTGKTGSLIADYLASELSTTHEIIYLGAKNSVLPKNRSIRIETFTDFRSLEEKLKNTVQENRIQALIMAAAVSDYSVDSIESEGEKLSGHKLSSGKSVTIRLKPNPKLITKVKSWIDYELQLVSFKLTSNASTTEIQEKVKAQLQVSDLVVHNDLSEMTSDKAIHPFHLYHRLSKLPDIGTDISSPDQLANYLKNYVTQTSDLRGEQ